MVQLGDSLHDMQWQKGQQNSEAVGLETQEDPMREFLGYMALDPYVETCLAEPLDSHHALALPA